jgi:hypothetical protein
MYPCEHFDIEGNGPGPNCPDHPDSGVTSEEEACQFYLDSFITLGPEEDIHKPCKERREHYHCDKTIDMFEEG